MSQAGADRHSNSEHKGKEGLSNPVAAPDPGFREGGGNGEGFPEEVTPTLEQGEA